MDTTCNEPGHDAIETLTGPFSSMDRRTSPRFPYFVNQSFAPIINGEVPNMAAFRPMRCRDISAGGISFFWPTAPQFTELVVALAMDGRTEYLRAKVVGSGAADLHVSEYVVRCQFLRRMVEVSERV